MYTTRAREIDDDRRMRARSYGNGPVTGRRVTNCGWDHQREYRAHRLDLSDRQDRYEDNVTFMFPPDRTSASFIHERRDGAPVPGKSPYVSRESSGSAKLMDMIRPPALRDGQAGDTCQRLNYRRYLGTTIKTIILMTAFAALIFEELAASVRSAHISFVFYIVP